MGGRFNSLILSVFLALPAAARAEAPAAPDRLAPAVVKDFCKYLKDVEAKTDEDCAPQALIALKKQDEAGFERKVALAQKRKADVQTAYEFLRTLPPDGAAPPKTEASVGQPGSDPLRLDPAINDRTFPIWVGAQGQDFKAVYSRWLEKQNAELERERQGPILAPRKNEIAAQLAQNQAKLSRLEKIKNPAALSCFLGENCNTRGDLSEPRVAATGAGRVWTAADYARANAQARAQIHAPGGKLDRDVPTIVAGEVVANSPLGPLTGPPPNKGGSAVRTAAELALVTTGGLLLLGGLGGKQLEERFPGIRRNMGIAAFVGGTLATGAFAWRSLAPALPIISQPQVQDTEQELLEEAEPAVHRVGQAAINLPSQGTAAELEGTPLEFAMRKEEARAVLSRLNLSADQSKSALSAVRRATASSNFRVSMDADNVVIRTIRAGRNGYQLMEYRIAPDGTKRVVQTAYDAAGQLVHYDPK